MDILELIPPKKKINGEVQIGGSKSYTNRALILAALAQGKSILSSVSLSEDSIVLIRALRHLGISVSQVDETTVCVVGTGGVFAAQKQTIDVGHAGTAMRFLTALCSVIPGEITLDGSARMRERPIGNLVTALSGMGANIVYVKNEGHPPLAIRGTKLLRSQVTISGRVSSQFISALLLIAPVLSGGLEITLVDEQISKSYIDMTIDSLAAFGVHVTNDNYKKYHIAVREKIQTTQYQVEGDASGASYLFALAAVSGGTIRVDNINPQSAQGDIRFPDILEQMGCLVVKNKNSITVTGPKKLTGISVDMSLMPDTAQTLAVVAAFAQGPTTITGLSTLKVKETDRIEATKNELHKMGVKCNATSDSLIIQGGIPHGASIKTYTDHRMALAFSVAGAVGRGIQIEDPHVVKKSFPTYWEEIQKLGIHIKKL